MQAERPGVPVSIDVRQRQPPPAVFSDDSQDGLGMPPLAYRTALVVSSPVPLRPVPDVTVRPGRS